MHEISGQIIMCQFCDAPLFLWLSHFYKCPKCGNIFNKDYQIIVYENNYFEGEYRNQYGKSYFDDKINIQKKMHKRLNLLEFFTGKEKNKSLLEIGSAAGFFLEIAKEKGYEVEGWEISKYMSEYANARGNKTIQGDFLTLLNQASRQYDIVAGFYVIEHFVQQKEIWTGFSKLVKENGFLILAIPYAFGPAFYFHRKQWINNHPTDHYMDYTQKGIKKVCSMFGFKILSVYPEGIHPERFPMGDKLLLRFLYSQFQIQCSFSDTACFILQKIY